MVLFQPNRHNMDNRSKHPSAPKMFQKSGTKKEIGEKGKERQREIAVRE